MQKQCCERCRCQEYIPTHQFVKFDEKVQYLCGKCWDYFRRWFFCGGRPKDVEIESAA